MIRRTIKTVTEEFDEQGRLRWRTTDDIVEEETEKVVDEPVENIGELECPVYLSFDEASYADCEHYLDQLASCDISKDENHCECNCEFCEEDEACCFCDDEIAVHVYLHVDGADVRG